MTSSTIELVVHPGRWDPGDVDTGLADGDRLSMKHPLDGLDKDVLIQGVKVLGAEDLAHVLVPLLKVLYLKTYQGGRLGHLGGRLGLIPYYMASGSLAVDLNPKLLTEVRWIEVSP